MTATQTRKPIDIYAAATEIERRIDLNTALLEARAQFADNGRRGHVKVDLGGLGDYLSVTVYDDEVFVREQSGAVGRTVEVSPMADVMEVIEALDATSPF